MSTLQPRNLVLIGPTGAGKSSIGRVLAQAMQWDFIDLDRLIEERVGATIGQIFTERDETYFRDQESLALQAALRGTNTVIATGAGCVLRQSNRELMREQAFVVHLCLDVQEQLDRLRRDTSRPLLQGDDRENVLREMARIRDPLYAETSHLQFSNGVARSSKGACAQLLTQLKHAWHD